jgi:hypothetical protein
MSKVVWLLPAIILISFSTARAQRITHVDIDLPSLDYDVIYLGDFIDVTSNKLSKDIPNFNGTIRANGSGYIVLDVTALIQLKGDPGPQELVFAETEPFSVKVLRTLSAGDLAAGSVTDIKVKGSPYRENASLRKRIEDYAKQFPTAPVGQYTLQFVVYDSSMTNVVGRVQKILTIRNASPDEVQINLLDPQPGAVIPTTVPTFSWNTPNPNVTLYVYEKLPIHQTPQDAINGNPYLKLPVTGAQTVTYPADATRRLEQNKSYVWFVETAVSTNRQTIERRSEVRLFRIRTTNQQSQTVSDIMNGFGGSSAGTYSTLQNIGWVPSGTITLDGKPVSIDDIKSLVAKLAAQNIQVTVRVE